MELVLVVLAAALALALARRPREDRAGDRELRWYGDFHDRRRRSGLDHDREI
jgi:hypothetical protein